MMGLADMAMRLAEKRGPDYTKGFWTIQHLDPSPRKYARRATHPVSAEYYAIIDRISRGEKP
jgi:hypothetical protein